MRRSGGVPCLTPAVALSFACALLAPAARAADPPPSTATTPTTTQTVEQLAARAYDLQASGRYADAVAMYLKAYDLSKDGLTLLNIATIYDRKLHENELAAEYYRRYAMAPDAEPDRVKKVTERLTVLKREADEERAKSEAPAPAAAPPPPPAATPPVPAPSPASSESVPEESNGHALRVAGIVVGAVGVAGLGASLALGLVARNKNDDANAVCNGTACASQSGVDLAHSAGSYATGSTVAFAAGLALVGGGVLLYVLAPKDVSPSSAARVYLAPRVDPQGAGLTLRGDF